MSTVKIQQVRRALEFLSLGPEAAVPKALKAEGISHYHKAQSWMQGEGTEALGCAEKISDGEKLDYLTLKIYVRKKLPKRKCLNLVPKKLNIPGLPTIETDVEEIGKIELQGNTTRIRPAVPGYSVSPASVDTAGTIGCVVRKKGQKSPFYLLSNSHAIAESGLLKKGAAIIEPGTFDGGTEQNDTIATLAEFIPFEFSQTGFPNLVDAAIAQVEEGMINSVIPQIGVPKGVSTVLRRGMKIQKMGRTTTYSIAEIKDVDVRLPMSYPRADGTFHRAGFRDQVLCTFYSSGGDSGSGVLNMDGKIVGLHIGGSETVGVFNKIENVLNLLDIEVVTEEIT